MNFQHLKHYDPLAGGVVVADLEWRDCPGRTIEVHIDVDPAYHRRGIGRSLIEGLEVLITERDGHKPMSMFTFMAADNEKAVGFFKGVGFHLYRIDNFYGFGRDAYFGCKPIGETK